MSYMDYDIKFDELPGKIKVLEDLVEDIKLIAKKHNLIYHIDDCSMELRIPDKRNFFGKSHLAFDKFEVSFEFKD